MIKSTCSSSPIFHDIKLVKTPGEHGRREILKTSGNVCGVIFNHPSEKNCIPQGILFGTAVLRK